MLPTILTIVFVLCAITLWFLITQHNLVDLDEKAKNAMCQIGLQLSSHYGALLAILDVAKIYDAEESEPLIEDVISKRSIVAAKSSPKDVLFQEQVISDVLDRLALISEKHPQLKTNRKYIKAMDAVLTYKNMILTSKLIYNDFAAKLNRRIRLFPVSMVSRLLKLTEREFLN
jgi:LemA protein